MCETLFVNRKDKRTNKELKTSDQSFSILVRLLKDYIKIMCLEKIETFLE